jgi:hypothetical protein
MPHNFNRRFKNALGLRNLCQDSLTDDRKLQQFSNCQNLKRANDKNLLKNVTTSDEMWVYGYDTETKQQFSHKKPCSTSLQESTTGALKNESNAACFS